MISSIYTVPFVISKQSGQCSDLFPVQTGTLTNGPVMLPFDYVHPS